MAVVPIDCTTSEGVLRIIKLMMPDKCAAVMSDDDMCALIESGSNLTAGAALVFRVMAARVAGIPNIRIGATYIEGSALSAKFLTLQQQINEQGLPGCSETNHAGPGWEKPGSCDPLAAGRFTDPRCAVCMQTFCGCGR